MNAATEPTEDRSASPTVDSLVIAAMCRAALIEVAPVWLSPAPGDAVDDPDVVNAVVAALAHWQCAILRTGRPERVQGQMSAPDDRGRCRIATAGRFAPGQLIEVKGGGERRRAIVQWCDLAMGALPADFVVAPLDDSVGPVPVSVEGNEVDPVEAAEAVRDATGTLDEHAAGGLIASAAARSLFADRFVTVLIVGGWSLCEPELTYRLSI